VCAEVLRLERCASECAWSFETAIKAWDPCDNESPGILKHVKLKVTSSCWCTIHWQNSAAIASGWYLAFEVIQDLMSFADNSFRDHARRTACNNACLKAGWPVMCIQRPQLCIRETWGYFHTLILIQFILVQHRRTNQYVSNQFSIAIHNNALIVKTHLLWLVLPWHGNLLYTWRKCSVWLL